MNILAISVAAIFVLSQHGSGKPNQVDKTDQYI